jgi:hypothetical protein
MIVGFWGAFREGDFFNFPTHNDFKLAKFEDRKVLEHANAYVTTGVRGVFKDYKDQYDYIAQTKKPVIVFEGATFRRNIKVGDDNYYYRIGLNDYTYNNGIFKNKNSPSDRWDMIQKEQDIEIKPWRSEGKYILLCLQNPTDTSLNDLYTADMQDKLIVHTKARGTQWNYINYLYMVMKKISSLTNEPIVVRFHPRFLEKYGNISPDGGQKGGFFARFREAGIRNKIIYSKNYDNFNETNGGSGFQKDLDGARVVVSYSSNALVESVCEGIPTVALSNTSHAWPVSYHTLDIIGESNIQCKFDRKQWLYDCAYTQWKQEEINSGIVHRRLLG